MGEQKYYLGLDIGTDSVGYAVTGEDYALKKFRGEPMWGAMRFDGASDASGRRAYRTARRRLDRRQQRVRLLGELFAGEIGAVDPNFFIRRSESALCREDTSCGVRLFEGGALTDEDYHRAYPTIHHLIVDLMNSDEPHDVRLVYMACAWLVAHRGHFLLDISSDDVSRLSDFSEAYREMKNYLEGDRENGFPWHTEDPDREAEVLLSILQKETGSRKKEEEIRSKLLQGKKPAEKSEEEAPYSEMALIRLLAGGTVEPQKLFDKEAYAGYDKVSLEEGDEEFYRTAEELEEEDGELLCQLRNLYNCARLNGMMNGTSSISAGKVKTYDQHREDLNLLRDMVKKYIPDQYGSIFRDGTIANNYVFYSGNRRWVSRYTKAAKGKAAAGSEDSEENGGGNSSKKKKASADEKAAFCDFLKKKLKDLPVNEEDRERYDEMMRRIEAHTFLPKQREGDNRVIPHQLYRRELEILLQKAQAYTPFLKEPDAEGRTVSEKILAIFDFRIPYFVGPLGKHPGKSGSQFAWAVRREEGRILPWNLEDLVDFEESEKRFIERMTNYCTYLHGEKVLPAHSLLYQKYMVLNELNNLKVDGKPISPEVKQELYTNLFEQYVRVTPKKVEAYLKARGYLSDQEELSGLDTTVKSGLFSYHSFQKMLNAHTLTEWDAEAIIKHAACTQDKRRLDKWLSEQFPGLPEDDRKHILKQKWQGFGRLSRRLLTGLQGKEAGSDGEPHTILEMLWETNDNLMQLLSEKYTFRKEIEQYQRENERELTLNERLSEMYLSNAVKRPIFRTLDILRDVEKAMGCAPDKIFVEMARGGTPDQKGKRTQSRWEQLKKLYQQVRDEDARQLQKELENTSDNQLQDKALYLYYLQCGKCAYSGAPMSLSDLNSGRYNLDHIYPQCYVKDDSLQDNLVLVKSELNGRKQDIYPVDETIRSRMGPIWKHWKAAGLMTDEKYRRLVRTTPFTESERQGFINRQLVETRQSTKAIAGLLKEYCPDSEIVYVKARLVSEFRQEFKLPKCRGVNDLHHAKDAFLNIAVGNVYHERFSKRWFSVSEDQNYNVQPQKIFGKEWKHGEVCYWHGEKDLERVRKTMRNQAVHLTEYALCRKGKLFEQPKKRGEGKKLIPRKKGLPAEKYGGYISPTVSFFALVRYVLKGKPGLRLMPVRRMEADRFRSDPAFRQELEEQWKQEIAGSRRQFPESLEVLRTLKIHTVFSLDGARMTLPGITKEEIILSPLTPLLVGKETEAYIKAMESFQNKRDRNSSIEPDEAHDGLSGAGNRELYDLLAAKLEAWPYRQMPGKVVLKGEEAETRFDKAPLTDQIKLLLGVLQWMSGKANTCDLSLIGGGPHSGKRTLNCNLSNWKKRYRDVRIIDSSAAGLFEQRSGNLLEEL